MKHAAFAAMAVLALSFTPANGLNIHNDNGGLVLKYALRFEYAPKPIRILGRCMSACTLALAYPSTCVGPRASLVFHAPYGAGKHNAAAKRWVMGRYPARVRSWIKAQGGLTSKPITLRGSALRNIVRSCK
jgi:hypothetical protein